MNQNITAQRIRELRKENGISALTLGKMVHKDQATIYRYEKEKITKIPYAVLTELANALNTSPSYLTGITDNRKRSWIDDAEYSGLHKQQHIEEIKKIVAEPELHNESPKLSEKEIMLLSEFIDNAGVLSEAELDCFEVFFDALISKHSSENK